MRKYLLSNLTQLDRLNEILWAICNQMGISFMQSSSVEVMCVFSAVGQLLIKSSKLL